MIPHLIAEKEASIRRAVSVGERFPVGGPPLYVRWKNCQRGFGWPFSGFG